MIERLRKLSILEGLPPEAVCYLNEGSVMNLKEDEPLFTEGEEAACFYIILSGGLRIYRTIKGETLEINDYEPGDTAGEMPLLTGTHHTTSGQAMEPSEIYRLEKEYFWKMMAHCPQIRTRVLEKVSERLRELQILTQQREKLISLGTLAAGLAHELNNPASAARRASQQLTQVVERLEKISAAMWYHCHSDEDIATMKQLEEYVAKSDGKFLAIDPLEQSDKEDELASWLDEQGMKEAGSLAASLVETGIDKQLLEPMLKNLSGKELNELVGWAEANISIKSLLKRLQESTIRISDLVQAVKEYSHSDMGMVQDVDLHRSIDNTLIILGHKLRRKKIKLVKEYDPDVTTIQGYTSKINQVWTNILDNAIEAVSDGGLVKIQTFRDNEMVYVDITDNGPGIPEDIQPHIFEPFFTTKGVGQGTGLGLEIVHHIVVTQHKGSVRLYSETGETTFSVALPEKIEE